MSIPAPKLQLSQGSWGQHRTTEQVGRREAVSVPGGSFHGSQSASWKRPLVLKEKLSA